MSLPLYVCLYRMFVRLYVCLYSMFVRLYVCLNCMSVRLYVCLNCMSGCAKRLRWSRGSVLAFGTQVPGFEPG